MKCGAAQGSEEKHALAPKGLRANRDKLSKQEERPPHQKTLWSSFGEEKSKTKMGGVIKILFYR